MFRQLFKKINRVSKKFQVILTFGAILTGCFGVFASGIFNPESKLEECAINLSEIAKNKSKNGKNLSIQISTTKKSDEGKLPGTYNEYFYWKYIFRHSDFSYISTVNGGKTHECFYNDIDTNLNITFLYSGNNSNHEYQGYYKHEVYDIRFMFRGHNKTQPDAINFMAISQSNADKLLALKGEVMVDNVYSTEQYESLLGTNTSLQLDEIDYNFTISNIYFEDGEFYYNLKETFGEFVVSYIRFPDSFEKEATYVFNKYTYQNLHKIKRIKMFFATGEFNVSTSRYNVVNNESLNTVLYNIFKLDTNNSIASILFYVFSLIVCAFAFFLFYAFENLHKLPWLLLFNALGITPYTVLWLINVFKPIPLLFSFTSLKVILIVVVSLIVFDVFYGMIFWRMRHEKSC